MAGNRSRRKGQRGQTEFAHLLTARGWGVERLSGGIKGEDIVAVDRFGRRWSVEVKCCRTITPAHRVQAQAQAHDRDLPWMLAEHIEGTSSWLVQRQGERPAVWTLGAPDA